MSEKGFTLIEVLVALFVATLILLPLSWTIAGLSEDLNESRKELLVDRTRADLAVLRQMLEAGRHFDGKQPLQRNTTSIEFEFPAPDALGRPGLIRARLDGVGDQVQLSFTDRSDGLAPIALFAPGDRLRFEYGESADLRFPRFIRLKLDPAKGPDRIITIAPRINGDGACEFDPISLQCRP